jgi:hypothetical protein
MSTDAITSLAHSQGAEENASPFRVALRKVSGNPPPAAPHAEPEPSFAHPTLHHVDPPAGILKPAPVVQAPAPEGLVKPSALKSPFLQQQAIRSASLDQPSPAPSAKAKSSFDASAQAPVSSNLKPAATPFGSGQKSPSAADPSGHSSPPSSHLPAHRLSSAPPVGNAPSDTKPPGPQVLKGHAPAANSIAVNGHEFLEKTYLTSTNCQVCAKLMEGAARQVSSKNK